MELSVSIQDLRGSISPSKVSMHGFRRLRKLDLPLEVAMCNIVAAAGQNAAPNESLVGNSRNQGLDDCEPFIGDLVPASVSQLSLISRGTGGHEKALDIMFRRFDSRKDSQLPALEEIHLSCPTSADSAYKDQCAKLFVETNRVGVALRLKLWLSAVTMTWDGEE